MPNSSNGGPSGGQQCGGTGSSFHRNASLFPQQTSSQPLFPSHQEPVFPSPPSESSPYGAPPVLGTAPPYFHMNHHGGAFHSNASGGSENFTGAGILSAAGQATSSFAPPPHRGSSPTSSGGGGILRRRSGDSAFSAPPSAGPLPLPLASSSAGPSPPPSHAAVSAEDSLLGRNAWSSSRQHSNAPLEANNSNNGNSPLHTTTSVCSSTSPSNATTTNHTQPSFSVGPYGNNVSTPPLVASMDALPQQEEGHASSEPTAANNTTRNSPPSLHHLHAATPVSSAASPLPAASPSSATALTSPSVPRTAPEPFTPAESATCAKSATERSPANGAGVSGGVDTAAESGPSASLAGSKRNREESMVPPPELEEDASITQAQVYEEAHPGRPSADPTDLTIHPSAETSGSAPASLDDRPLHVGELETLPFLSEAPPLAAVSGGAEVVDGPAALDEEEEGEDALEENMSVLLQVCELSAQELLLPLKDQLPLRLSRHEEKSLQSFTKAAAALRSFYEAKRRSRERTSSSSIAGPLADAKSELPRQDLSGGGEGRHGAALHAAFVNFLYAHQGLHDSQKSHDREETLSNSVVRDAPPAVPPACSPPALNHMSHFNSSSDDFLSHLKEEIQNRLSHISSSMQHRGALAEVSPPGDIPRELWSAVEVQLNEIRQKDTAEEEEGRSTSTAAVVRLVQQLLSQVLQCKHLEQTLRYANEQVQARLHQGVWMDSTGTAAQPGQLSSFLYPHELETTALASQKDALVRRPLPSTFLEALALHTSQTLLEDLDELAGTDAAELFHFLKTNKMLEEYLSRTQATLVTVLLMQSSTPSPPPELRVLASPSFLDQVKTLTASWSHMDWKQRAEEAKRIQQEVLLNGKLGNICLRLKREMYTLLSILEHRQKEKRRTTTPTSVMRSRRLDPTSFGRVEAMPSRPSAMLFTRATAAFSLLHDYRHALSQLLRHTLLSPGSSHLQRDPESSPAHGDHLSLLQNFVRLPPPTDTNFPPSTPRRTHTRTREVPSIVEGTACSCAACAALQLQCLNLREAIASRQISLVSLLEQNAYMCSWYEILPQWISAIRLQLAPSVTAAEHSLGAAANACQEDFSLLGFDAIENDPVGSDQTAKVRKAVKDIQDRYALPKNSTPPPTPLGLTSQTKSQTQTTTSNSSTQRSALEGTSSASTVLSPVLTASPSLLLARSHPVYSLSEDLPGTSAPAFHSKTNDGAAPHRGTSEAERYTPTSSPSGYRQGIAGIQEKVLACYHHVLNELEQTFEHAFFLPAQAASLSVEAERQRALVALRVLLFQDHFKTVDLVHQAHASAADASPADEARSPPIIEVGQKRHRDVRDAPQSVESLLSSCGGAPPFWHSDLQEWFPLLRNLKERTAPSAAAADSSPPSENSPHQHCSYALTHPLPALPVSLKTRVQHHTAELRRALQQSLIPLVQKIQPIVERESTQAEALRALAAEVQCQLGTEDDADLNEPKEEENGETPASTANHSSNVMAPTPLQGEEEEEGEEEEGFSGPSNAEELLAMAKLRRGELQKEWRQLQAVQEAKERERHRIAQRKAELLTRIQQGKQELLRRELAQQQREAEEKEAAQQRLRHEQERAALREPQTSAHENSVVTEMAGSVLHNKETAGEEDFTRVALEPELASPSGSIAERVLEGEKVECGGVDGMQQEHSPASSLAPEASPPTPPETPQHQEETKADVVELQEEEEEEERYDEQEFLPEGQKGVEEEGKGHNEEVSAPLLPSFSVFETSSPFNSSFSAVQQHQEEEEERREARDHTVTPSMSSTASHNDEDGSTQEAQPVMLEEVEEAPAEGRWNETAQEVQQQAEEEEEREGNQEGEEVHNSGAEEESPFRSSFFANSLWK